jgi:hypothetical protein
MQYRACIVAPNAAAWASIQRVAIAFKDQR